MAFIADAEVMFEFVLEDTYLMGKPPMMQLSDDGWGSSDGFAVVR
jgi:hypothetical protein